jgi:hypothetical protein
MQTLRGIGRGSILMAQRYCTNCGAELREDDSFCGKCGRPVQETAVVSTPEADVPVPPAPQAGEEHRPRISLGQFVVGLLVFIGVLWLLVSTGYGSSGGGSNRSSGDEGGKKAAAGNAGNETMETFTKENYAELYSDPRAHKGASVDITGQLLERPEESGGELAFQMFVDVENSDWNTIVYTDQTDLDLNMDDYVRVRGEVLGSLKGKNAFGGSITAPTVQASKVSTVSAGQAIDPATEVRVINRTVGGQGFDVTLQKI